ncbi:recombinase family protein [Streptococcus sp. A12]|uniref:recombinase family protein n=1 Tax=Streptococcus sp. A12 TaxID=1759399 RepID=UPI0025F8BD16|nr:recombinase family protein [Streptococcus sp. A12]
MIRKVAIYARVSTTNQAEEGYSIDGQIDSLEKYCEAMGWDVYNKYIDAGFSGGSLKRPEMANLINDVKKGLFDTVLVYKLDRLSRNVRDTLYLIKDVFNINKIDFVSIQENIDTSSAMGTLFLTLLSAIAEFEREQIKERMQLGKLGRAKSGKSMMWGRTSYGYDYKKETGSLIINPAQSLVVKYIFERYLAGRSITKLRDDLNERYPKEISWNYRAVRGILSNPVYCGYNQYKGQLFPGEHESIISEYVYKRTQEELKIRQRTAAEKTNPRPFQAKYMLSGMAQCGYCHAPLKLIMGGIRKDGTRFIRYECYQRHPRKTTGVTVYNNNQKCHSGAYDKDELEKYVITEISKLQHDQSYIEQLFSTQSSAIDRDSYQKQIDELTKKLSRLNDLYIDDRITLDELQKRSSEFMTMRTALEEELKNDPEKQSQERRNNIKQVLDCEDIASIDYDGQKAIARALIDKVQVTSERIVINWRI